MTHVTQTHLRLPWVPADTVAYTLDHVLSADECAAWLAKANQVGFIPATIHVDEEDDKQEIVTDVRNNTRAMIDDPVLAGVLFARLLPFLPATWVDSEDGAHYVLAGLNERLRFLRYEPGQHFAPHHDECYRRPDAGTREQSYLTVQLYLDECPSFAGGSTTFLDPNGTDAPIDCVPRQGRVLVFDQNLLHQGSRVSAGVKHCVRTDVMFRRVIVTP
jgi:prolyl 4-hydroxylase